MLLTEVDMLVISPKVTAPFVTPLLVVVPVAVVEFNCEFKTQTIAANDPQEPVRSSQT